MKIKRLKISTFVGTRPELIRLSEIIKRFDEVFDHRLVHTGQNYSPSLSDIFFKDLDIRQPDLYLNLANQSVGGFLGELFKLTEKEFIENRPDALVILGDTNSSLISILAKRMNIPIYHLEAGNRSFDSNVPEEINRKIIDHSSDFNLAYTEAAKNNLIREGVHPRNITVIGSPLREVIENTLKKSENSTILKELKVTEKEFFLVSAHRQENIDSDTRLSELVSSINLISEEFNSTVIISLHPRLKDKVKKLNIEFNKKVKLVEPFNFTDYLKLQISARLVLSDSGSISEECAILGIKGLTIRNSMERPEALDSGNINLAGINPDSVIQNIYIVEKQNLSKTIPNEYQVSDTSTRVVNYISSTIHQYKFWTGIR
jgi:UDP-N-acetylglucosamine 2-epimerase (non-hydrolysing)